jgi:hypothetical protein
MHFSVYYVFYSLYSHQHVSDAIAAIFRVISLLQEYGRTNVFNCHHHSIKIKNWWENCEYKTP